MNFVNAEITKIAVNCFCTTKISYANSLADLCETIPQSDASVICAAIGLDRRIGPLYLKPGTAFSGPCFPRDNRAMLALGNMPLARATDEINNRQPEKLMKLALETKPRKVSVLGLSYKTATAVTEESVGVKLTDLLNGHVEVFSHDPMAAPSENWRDHVKQSDVVVITVAWELYKGLKSHDFKHSARIVDCWGLLDQNQFADQELLITGRGAQ